MAPTRGHRAEPRKSAVRVRAEHRPGTEFLLLGELSSTSGWWDGGLNCWQLWEEGSLVLVSPQSLPLLCLPGLPRRSFGARTGAGTLCPDCLSLKSRAYPGPDTGEPACWPLGWFRGACLEPAGVARGNGRGSHVVTHSHPGLLSRYHLSAVPSSHISCWWHRQPSRIGVVPQ